MRILVTGCYGFIGSRTCQVLASQGHEVLGVDRIRDARSYKADRVAETGIANFTEADLANDAHVRVLVARLKPEVIVHLAGQYSIPHGADSTRRYVDSNILSHLNILEAAEANKVRRVVYASSTAVSDNRKPSGLYGATLGFREEAAHVYSRRGVETIGLRYGAVYGPMMRRDTDIYRAVSEMLTGKKIRACKAFREAKPFVEVGIAALATAAAATINPLPVAVAHVVDFDCEHLMSHVLDAVGEHLGVAVRYPQSFNAAEHQAERRRNHTRDMLALTARRSATLRAQIGPFAEWIAKEIKL